MAKRKSRKANTARTTKAQSKAKRGKPSATNALNFVAGTHSAIHKHLRAAVELPDFLASTGDLTIEQRRALVRQAQLLINSNFVHLPLKEAMHGVYPSQKLALIQHKLEQAEDSTMGSEYSFHREMIEIFTSVRDLHTNYILPAPFAQTIAFMPFNVEEYFDNNQPHYIATHIVEGFSHAHFKQGVEITTWNGVPIERAIEIAANLHAGSNSAARHARGVDGLTLRSLANSQPPDENWVIVGYLDRNGIGREMRQEWIVVENLPDSSGVNNDTISEAAAASGLDIEADVRQRARKMLFAPDVIAIEKRKTKAKLTITCASAGEAVPSAMAGVFRASSVETSFGVFGYIRIFTFNVSDPDEFIEEFIRLVELLPRQGLILDVRGNGGGHIHASEGLLQTLTPIEITPEPTQFINTSLNLRICKIHKDNPAGIDLGPWYESIRDSITTGAIYSRAFPITPHEYANEWGQQYHGPVVLITDARCYSATDIFAAGFQDHNIGDILGVDNNTGAGGANVWTHNLLKELIDFGGESGDDNPYEILPEGANMRVAIRRTLRVGELSGTPVEDIGVTPDHIHIMTKEDLLNKNIDLINAAAKILNSKPVRQLDISMTGSDTELSLEVTTLGLDRLDFYIDDRPIRSENVTDAEHMFSLSIPDDAKWLAVAGYDAGNYVAARSLLVNDT